MGDAARARAAGPGARAFSYSRQVSPIIGAFIFVSLVELPVVHLLLPWDAARIAALVLSVWGLLWMVGLLASMKVYPHLIDDAGLRIRYGTTTDIRVPWEAVASVTARRRSVPTGRHVHLGHGDDGANGRQRRRDEADAGRRGAAAPDRDRAARRHARAHRRAVLRRGRARLRRDGARRLADREPARR